MPEIKQDLRTATMIVAAGNSLHRNMANYACDMVADDVEIQAALNAVAAGPSTMGRVILLDGWYFCTAGITIPDNVTLEGQERGTIIDFSGAAIVNGLIINGDYVSIKNLAVNIADDAGVVGARPNAIYSTGYDHTWLENIYAYGDESVADDLSDLRQCGILLVNGSDSKITNCFVRDFLRHGIHLNNYIDTTIEGNSSLSNGQWGILVFNNSDWNVIVGNKNYINGHGGINIATSDDCTITGNVCDTNDLHGILLWDSDRNTVTGNVCVDNDAHGINLETSTDNIISGNACHNNDRLNTGSYDGINVDVNSSRNQVTGNVCNLNHRYGICIGGGQNSVVGNMVAENDQHGIFNSGPYCSIKSNYIYVNGKDAAGTYHGIYCQGTDCSINDNFILDTDTWMDDGIHLPSGGDRIQIVGNYINNLLGDGIQLTANNDDCLIKANYCYHNEGFGINIAAATCDRATVKNNKLLANVLGAINDLGTDTALPFIYVPVHNPDAFIGNHPAEDLPDNVVTITRLSLYIPAEFQELVRIQAFVVAVAAGDLNYDVDTDYGKVCASEDYNTHGAAVADRIHTCVINDIECVDLVPATTLANLAAQDLVGVQFTRDGVVGTDTIAEHVYLIGVRMQYV